MKTDSKAKVNLSKAVSMPVIRCGMSVRNAGSARLIPLSEVDRLPGTPARSEGHVVGKRHENTFLMF